MIFAYVYTHVYIYEQMYVYMEASVQYFMSSSITLYYCFVKGSLTEPGVLKL